VQQKVKELVPHHFDAAPKSCFITRVCNNEENIRFNDVLMMFEARCVYMVYGILSIWHTNSKALLNTGQNL
jgi:hypothetical protein